MERVSARIDALRKAASESKDKAVRSAARELGSILTLLQSSSTKNHAKLVTIFSEKLDALYPASLRQMCRLCADVLTAIFHEKIKPAFDAKDNELQLSWENVQKAVVSSVFDFVEQDTTNSKNKDVVADALYPVFCAMFYPPKPVIQWRSPSLIFNVNLLLSETAAGHVENQKRLRSKEVLGPTRIGNVLSQSKEFFVLDTLVGLLGVLLPARDAGVKRTQFVDAVFRPELFTRSAEIKNLIATSVGTEWDPVVTRILDCLAKSDVSFPQPFYISGLRTSTPLPNIVDPLYVDNQALYANVDERRAGWNAHPVPGVLRHHGAHQDWRPRRVLDVSLSAIDGSAAHWPPSETVTPEAQKKCTMQFQLKKEDARRFLDTLKARGLVHVFVRRTSSLATPKCPKSWSLSLEFQLERSETAANSGEGVLVLICEHHSGDDGGNRKKKSRRWRKHDAIDGDELTDVSDGDDKLTSKATSKAKPTVPKMKTPPRRVTIADDSDDEQEEIEVEQTQSSSPTPNTKDEDFEPTQPEAARVSVDVPARVTRGAAKKNPATATEEAVSKPTSSRAKTAAAAARDEDTADVPALGRSLRRQTARKSVAPGKSYPCQRTRRWIQRTRSPALKLKKPLLPTLQPRNVQTEKLIQVGSSYSRSAAMKLSEVASVKVKTEIASKLTKPEPKSEPKRRKTDEDEVPDSEDEDEPSRPTKRLRGQTTAPKNQSPFFYSPDLRCRLWYYCDSCARKETLRRQERPDLFSLPDAAAAG
ncbi:hypothetical protein B0H12DRAFT_1076292 [Mycena haematopus]|nr:hypothetical protein B0H12DRAFT_1076292 [Mycena haematopus]